MKRTFLVIVVIVAAVVLVAVACISPILYDVVRGWGERGKLQSRSDYPKIVAASVTLAGSVTDGSFLVYPTNNNAVPAFLRSLAPHYITVHTNEVVLEFHGGFDHYGYKVRQSDTNRWTIYYYTEKSERPLATITND